MVDMNWLGLLAGMSDGQEPLYAQITRSISNAIKSGELKDNSRLPTNRELASLLQVDRSTVSRAYAELAEAGLIESHVGRGTFVRSGNGRRLSSQSESTAANTNVDWSFKFSEASKILSDLIGRQPAAPTQEDIISFGGGIPIDEFYPHEKFKEIVSELTQSSQSNDMFGYSAAEGHPALRQQVRKHLRGHGIECGEDELLVVSGSQQGIDLVTNVLVSPGDQVLLEDPSYFWAICNFRAKQAKCLPVPLDAEGLRIDVLENLLTRSQPKLLYVMPSYQNPTGNAMTMNRRLQLLEVAKRFKLPILEDNFVGDLSYDRDLLPPLKSLPGGAELVIHQGTFSKALCPGLRLGWLVAPPEVTFRLFLAKRSSDLSTNSIAQIILAKYLEEGLYSQHLEHVREQYRQRRDAMAQSLSKHTRAITFDGEQLTWTIPQGGLFMWAKLPDGLSARDLLRFAENEGVSFSPGDTFFLNADHSEYLRLCFIQTDEIVINKGIERLAQAMRKYFESIHRVQSSKNDARTRAQQNVLI